MKKYNKPSVNIVSLNSSENIAKLTFDSIQNKLVRDYLYSDNKTYKVSVYTVTSSVIASGKES